MKFPTPEPPELRPGDRVVLSGGYDFEPHWLSGRDSYAGVITRFIPGQNREPAAVVLLDEQIVLSGAQGRIAVLELRYENAQWLSRATVHIELCDFEPEEKSWKDRRQGVWVEAAATLTRLS